MTPDRRSHYSEGLAGYSRPLLRPRSWTRWAVFLAINMVGFAAATLFWQYLRTGQVLRISGLGLQEGLTASMGQVFIEPLGIFHHPWLIVVFGALLATMIVVPIMMAEMYQLLLSLVFVAMVALLAQAPLFALALALGCVVTARTRLRRDYPYLASLMGMAPVAIYLFLFVYPSIDASYRSPLERWALLLPLLGAMVLAAVAAGGVVLMARITRFQPGVVWPVLLALLPLAAVPFWWKVTPAELQYAVLTAPLSGGEELFPDMSQKDWLRRQGEGLNELTHPSRLTDDLEGRRAALVRHCSDFLSRYSGSRRCPAVAWIAAQTQCLQLAPESFEGNVISYTSFFPFEASEPAWRELLANYPDSPQAALARWRISVLQFRKVADLPDGDPAVASTLAEGWADLTGARARLATIVEEGRRTRQEREKLFTRSPSMPALEIYQHALQSARRLEWIIAGNEVLNDHRRARVLARWQKLNPLAPSFQAGLRALAQEASETCPRLADNLRLELAKLHPDAYDRAEALLEVADDERTDAAIEANFELGLLASQKALAPMIGLTLKDPGEYFQLVIDSPPNPFQARAAERLAWLKTTPGSETP